MDNRRVFSFLNDRLGVGRRAVLVTVIAVEGSSMREPGTHMGVCEDGSFAGSLSGGCIENAVVAEALDALNANAPRVVRFGNGSPYIDIKLPCGGGLDIHFLPLSDHKLIGQCVDAIGARTPFSLELSLDVAKACFVEAWQATAQDSSKAIVTIGHWPEPKLLIIGHGATVTALARMARQMDVTVQVLSPDDMLVGELTGEGIAAAKLSAPSDVEPVQTDPWTAVVFLFHDHDWEIALLKHALDQPHFYIGAMGGRKADAFRSEALTARGVNGQSIASIHAPIGLFHSSRDPQSLALSTLGEVIQTYHQSSFNDG